MKEREKRVIVGGVAVAGLVALYCWIVEPICQWADRVDAELALAEGRLQEARLATLKYGNLLRRIAKLRGELGITGETSASFIESLEKACKECGVTISRVEQLVGRGEASKGEWHALRVRAECDTPALTKLLLWLHRGAGAAVVDRLLLSAHGKKPGIIAAELDVRTCAIASAPLPQDKEGT